jgi:hypothetical protein
MNVSILLQFSISKKWFEHCLSLIRFPLPIPWLHTCVIASATLRGRMFGNTQSRFIHKNIDSHSFPARESNPSFKIDSRSDPLKISRPYLLSVNYFTTRACGLWINNQVDLSLTNESINYSSKDQSINLAFYDWHCISKQSNRHERPGRSRLSAM